MRTLLFFKFRHFFWPCALFLVVLQAQAKDGQASSYASGSVPMASVLASSSMEPGLRLIAMENNRLKNELTWSFGGKSQQGWGIYIPLIRRLIADAGRDDVHRFTLSVAQWQNSKKQAPTGLVNSDTWSTMVAAWQAARVKNIVEPHAEQLLVAPTPDFYDPARPEELRKVERETYAAYKRMIAAAVADPSSGLKASPDGGLESGEKYLTIVSAYRSQEYQNQLRRNSPHSGRAGLASHSPHLTGRALDLYVGGEPVNTATANRAIQVKTPAYLWLVQNAEKFGFHPYFYEPWHWEYCGS